MKFQELEHRIGTLLGQALVQAERAFGRSGRNDTDALEPILGSVGIQAIEFGQTGEILGIVAIMKVDNGLTLPEIDPDGILLNVLCRQTDDTKQHPYQPYSSHFSSNLTLFYQTNGCIKSIMTNKVNENYPTQIPNFTFLPLLFTLFNIDGRMNTSSQVHINPEMSSSISQSSVWFGEFTSWFRQFTPWFRQSTLQFWFCLCILQRKRMN